MSRLGKLEQCSVMKVKRDLGRAANRFLVGILMCLCLVNCRVTQKDVGTKSPPRVSSVLLTVDGSIRYSVAASDLIQAVDDEHRRLFDAIESACHFAEYLASSVVTQKELNWSSTSTAYLRLSEIPAFDSGHLKCGSFWSAGSKWTCALEDQKADNQVQYLTNLKTIFTQDYGLKEVATYSRKLIQPDPFLTTDQVAVISTQGLTCNSTSGRTESEKPQGNNIQAR